MKITQKYFNTDGVIKCIDKKTSSPFMPHIPIIANQSGKNGWYEFINVENLEVGKVFLVYDIADSESDCKLYQVMRHTEEEDDYGKVSLVREIPDKTVIARFSADQYRSIQVNRLVIPIDQMEDGRVRCFEPETGQFLFTIMSDLQIPIQIDMPFYRPIESEDQS